ncbi:MAG: IS4 family transposase [Saprospiraceae bacterium]|nr:IS4 family transposase [Saprospiraceae bacterium]
MSKSKLRLFSQMLSLIDRSVVRKAIQQHDSDKYSKGINTWTHFVSMIFMQITELTSLRDISNGLMSATGNLNHLGITKPPRKSSMSYINKHRTFEVFQDIYFKLLDRMEPSLQRQRMYARNLKRKIFIMDASIIPLCHSLFDWAKFRTRKGAVKLHAVLDYDTGLPSYAFLSDGKKHEINVARNTDFPAESVIVVDRAYVDFNWLNKSDSTGVFFVTRLKANADIKVVTFPKNRPDQN